MSRGWAPLLPPTSDPTHPGPLPDAPRLPGPAPARRRPSHAARRRLCSHAAPAAILTFTKAFQPQTPTRAPAASAIPSTSSAAPEPPPSTAASTSAFHVASSGSTPHPRIHASARRAPAPPPPLASACATGLSVRADCHSGRSRHHRSARLDASSIRPVATHASSPALAAPSSRPSSRAWTSDHSLQQEPTGGDADAEDGECRGAAAWCPTVRTCMQRVRLPGPSAAWSICTAQLSRM